MQYSRQQLEEPSGPATIAPKHLQPEALKPKSPDLPDSSAASGTVGELPTITSTSRSRFGRNRTDTMVFADVDASGVAFELAAKARAGDFDVDFELDEPRTAKPATESERDGAENEKHEEPENLDRVCLDSDLEISLDPEEEILEPASGDATTTETGAKEETAIPDIEVEASVKDEAVVSATDIILAIDSATMDEHIPPTISEEADEAEPPESSVNGGDVQASELDPGDISALIEESTVTELAAPPVTPPSITESSTDETLAPSLLISENPVVPTEPEDLPDSSVSHDHHEAENVSKSSPSDAEESVIDKQTGTTGNVADPILINE